MKKIPPEIDSLMWAVAESGDMTAVENFEARYPVHKYELGKRLAMVRALKSSKPENSAILTQRFRPTQAPVRLTRHRLSWVPVAALLSALASAAFFGGMYVFNPKSDKPNTSAPVATTERFDGSGNTLEYRQNTPPTTNVQPNQPNLQTPPPVQMEGRYTVKLEDVGLVSALEMIGLQCNADVQVAPGFENPTITVDYKDMTIGEILADLGQKFGFTPLKQGGREYLLIPAVDKSTAPKASDSRDAGSNVGIDARTRPNNGQPDSDEN
ncbi:MAG: hypothetical protein KF784_09725 [Fimbriimonadaceae bacterium]|nr:hypothetical protein [Fimbriimonadaceae bacterium]